MTAAAIVPPLVHGKHNMASDAFAALGAARGAEPATAEAATSEGPSFADLVDTLNPLQHIPVVAQIYRHLTGDTLSPLARVAGGALYGGPIGLVASVVDAAIASETGNDLGGHMIAALTGDEPETAVVAAAAPTAATPTAAHAAPRPAAPKTTATAVPGPLPQLSAEAFNALVNSFADPEAAKAANPILAAKAANIGG